MKGLEKYNVVTFGWVVRAGIRGSADRDFMKNNLIVLSDPGLGDLTRIEPNRQSFYNACRLIGPKKTRRGITGAGSKFFRFVHEMSIGDVVIYPSIEKQEVFIGEITSQYQFDRKNDCFPHQRKVRWITSFEKDTLSKGARHELGAARTLFKYDKHFDEILQNILVSEHDYNQKHEVKMLEM